MALEKALLPVVFSGGMNTKTDPKRVVPGEFLLLQNAVFRKDGRIQKRNGYDYLTTNLISGGTLSQSEAALGFLDEMIQFSNNSIYTYSESAEAWLRKGSCYSVTNSNETVVRNTSAQSQPDLAVVENIAVYVYKDSANSAGVNMTVTDTKSGTVFQNNVVLTSSGACPRVVTVLNQIFVLYVSGTNLVQRAVSVSSPTQVSATVTIASDCLNANYAIDVVSNGSNALISYVSSASTDVKVAYLTATGILGSVSTGFPNPIEIGQTASIALSIAVSPFDGTIIVFYVDSTSGLRYTALYPDFTTRQSNIVIDSDVTTPALRVAPYVMNIMQIGIFYEKATSSAQTYDHIILQRTLSVVGGGGSSVVVARSLGLASKAFQIDSAWYVNTVHDSVLQATYFAITTTGEVVSKMLPTLAGGLPQAGVLPSVVTNSDTASFPALLKTKFISQGNTTFTLVGLSLSTLNFKPSQPHLSVTSENTLIISGGYVQAYDGNAPVELGFHFFPENITATPASSGGSMSAGTYEYFVVYEWLDRNGDAHRSSPSVPISVTTSGSGSQVTLSIPTLRVTKKTSVNGLSNVVCAIYRTQSLGTVAYKVSSISAPTYNDVTTDRVSFVDTVADSSILANQILYTSGNVLENDAPTSASLVDVNKNRVVLAGLEDPYVFAYSKQRVTGDGVSFSQNLTYRVNSTGGPITTIKYMDDNIVVFKARYVYYIVGKGPDDTGSNNDFSDPGLVTSDAGCDNPASCVLMPLGLMYQSQNGIYLLDRALQNKYIGAPVEAYNDQKITSAVLVSDFNEVRFTTDQGICIVYNYYYNRWSVFTNQGGVGAGLWKDSQYFVVQASGQARVENKESFLDNGLSYPLLIKTGWLKLQALQGYQRMRAAYFIGDYLTAHKLRVQIAYDYEEFFSQVSYFDASTLVEGDDYGSLNYGDESTYGGVTSGVEQFRINLKKQKCQAIQFQIDDIQNPETGEGYSLSEIMLAIGIKAGAMKLPASKKVS